MKENQNDQQDMPLKVLLGIPFSQYLHEMATDGTYGLELTLLTASDTYNVDITLISSLGHEGQLEINPNEFQTFGRIVLGHFTEGYGEHYAGLDQEWQENQNGSSRSSCNEQVKTNLDFNLSESDDHDSYTSPSKTERNDDSNSEVENFPSAKEHEQNDETRSHSGKLSNLI